MNCSDQKNNLIYHDTASQPLVSVLLPVYNGTKYLKEAIDCILQQTYSKLELIIIDDGSKDNPSEIIEHFNDQRIKFLKQENTGLAGTLNRAISLSKGKYLARQDQDDISKPDRIQKQVNFLEANPKCGMTGTWAQIWTENKPSNRVHEHPADNPLLQMELLFTNPFVHSSVMIRKSCIDDVGGYTNKPTRHPPEDYELWSRISRNNEVANIPEHLVIYREVEGSMSRVANQKYWDAVYQISAENIAFLLDNKYDIELLKNIPRLVHSQNFSMNGTDMEKISDVLMDISFSISEKYPSYRQVFRKNLRNRYFHIIYHRNSNRLYSLAQNLISFLKNKFS